MTDYMKDIAALDQIADTDPIDLLGRVAQCGGKKYIYARAGAGLTKLTPYSLQYEGGVQSAVTTADPVVKTLLATAVKQLVVIPVFRDLADNDTGWFQFQGLVEDVVVSSWSGTATHALKVDAGALVTTGGASANADTEVGALQVTASTASAIDIFLFGREALTET